MLNKKCFSNCNEYRKSDLLRQKIHYAFSPFKSVFSPFWSILSPIWSLCNLVGQISPPTSPLRFCFLGTHTDPSTQRFVLPWRVVMLMVGMFTVIMKIWLAKIQQKKPGPGDDDDIDTIHELMMTILVVLTTHGALKTTRSSSTYDTIYIYLIALVMIGSNINLSQTDLVIMRKHCQSHNGPKALNTLTHSTTLL